jgi:hypothetical protein
VFGHNHGFTLSQVGLCFLGIFIGMVIGVASDPIWRRNYERLIRNREQQTGEKGGSEPEFRLPPTIAGSIIVPVGLFGKLQIYTSWSLDLGRPRALAFPLWFAA